MKNLNVNNEMNYKALYESAMKELVKAELRIAELEAENEELKAELVESDDRTKSVLDLAKGAIKSAEESTMELEESKQKVSIYEFLLLHVKLATDGLGLEKLSAIMKEYEAIIKGKTTGFVYTPDEEFNAKLLEGYELSGVPAVEHVGNVSYVKFGE